MIDAFGAAGKRRGGYVERLRPRIDTPKHAFDTLQHAASETLNKIKRVVGTHKRGIWRD
jgi:hypothetical protein